MRGVVEDNDSNNDATIQILVTEQQPDLILDTLAIASPAQPYAGEPVTFTVTLHNGGEVAAPPTLSGVYLDPGPISACSTPASPISLGSTSPTWPLRQAPSR